MEDRRSPEDRRFVRRLFSHGPYTKCPSQSCGLSAFGLPVLGIKSGRYAKECYECGFSETYPLPPIKKRIVYLDQFVIDNLVKSLDPGHPKHESVKEDPFWTVLYEKLEPLTRAQLVICPDSFYHREESGPTGYFKYMERMYEHLSGGATFHDIHWVTKAQMGKHFRSYLRGEPEKEPDLDHAEIVTGDLNTWWDRMRISVSMKPTREMVDTTTKSKDATYRSFVQIFGRWQTESHKGFEDFYKEETRGFADGTVQAISSHTKRRRELFAKIQSGEEPTMDDLFPPMSWDLVSSLIWIGRREGLSEEEAGRKVLEYLYSPHIDRVPAVRIGSLLLAAIADSAARGGRKKLPSPGVVTDLNMIAAFLPYCDVMFLDKENEQLLSDSRVKGRLGFGTRVFSRKSKEAFLSYLDEILAAAEPEHLTLVERVYGPNWRNPYRGIMVHEREQQESGR